jgi:HEAT repeat protein
MRRYRDPILFSVLFTGLVLLCGFGAREEGTSTRAFEASVNRHISLLRSKEAQQKAAAAYWLGSRGMAAERAIPALIATLGDQSRINAATYRKAGLDDVSSLTVGQEAAAALVNIGKSSTDALIKTLMTSPEAHARENAAWALGALHRREMI